MSANATLAERFETLARLMELQDEDKFKVLAHAKAARIADDSTVDLAALARGENGKKALLAIPGIGPKIADKIAEFAATGRISEVDERLAQVPAGLIRLMEIPGLGPKTVRLLWKDRGVTDLASLRKIIDDGSILTLPRMGAKAVGNLKQSIAFQESSGGRLPLGIAMPIARRLASAMEKIPGVERVAFAGSLRRGKDTIGDIDILCATTRPQEAVAAFVAREGVLQVLSQGETKASVRLAVDADLGRWSGVIEGDGQGVTGASVQADLRVVPKGSWGAALAYFTGSKEHNVQLRERALARGLTLNEYGLYPDDQEKTPPHHRGVKPVAGLTEASIYEALDLDFVEPELREGRGELSWREKKHKPPALIDLGDIKAELHAHTTASDGLLSIEELARKAKERGFHTIAVTDHSKSQTVANGLSPERLLAHIEAVHRAREKVKDIRILAGSEVDILADGTLDYEDSLLSKLDVVVASPHNALNQEPAAATRRLLRAIRHPLVHILGHPTGRLINRRPGLDPDLSALIQAAIEHRTALEINAHWMRLDLRDTHVRAAVEMGCLIAIDCDVHDPHDYDNLEFGVLTARRGGLTREQCVNAWSQKKLAVWLRSKGRD
jgi:DNA polymerase (family X)